MELKVKDFAAAQGVSESIIYRHIRRHRTELGDMIVKRGRASWLTDEAQEYLCNIISNSPLVVSDNLQSKEIERLKLQVAALQERLIDTQERLLSAQEAFLEGQKAQLSLQAATDALEAKSEALERAQEEIAQLKARSWWQMILKR